MNPIIEFFQGLAAQVPDLIQPFIIAAAGAVPFVEGEISSLIGVWAGMNPIVAGIAGAIGNFICVAVIVLLGARARRAVVTRRSEKRELAAVGAGPSAEALPADVIPGDAGGETVGDTITDGNLGEGDKPESKGRIKFKNFLTRFGVPGASLLGPLAIPTQITSTILVGAGVKTSWILLWQGIAIIAWTALITLFATGSLALLGG